MAFPTTVPAFDRGNDASQWVLYKGSTTSTPLGQVRNFSWTDTIETVEQKRVSDAKKYRTKTGRDVAITLELHQDADNVEPELFYGSAGFTIDAVPFTFIAEMYNGTATDSTLVATYTFANFDVLTAEAGPREAGSDTYWAFTAVADSVTVS